MNVCISCNIETKNAKYCSRSCANKESNKVPKRKITRTCTECNLLVKDYRSSLCQVHFNNKKLAQSEEIKLLSIKNYTQRDSIKNLHISSKYAHIRQFARSWHKHLSKLPCANCGYEKHVELCHIKPLSSFHEDATLAEVNDITNIIQLCPNCHWELDNAMLTIEQISVKAI